MLDWYKQHKRWFFVCIFIVGLVLSVTLTSEMSSAQNKRSVNYPRNQALYVTMRDSTKIAIDVWLPQNLSRTAKIPTIMRATRYWRSREYADKSREFDPNSNLQYREAKQFNNSGYALVLVDARGTGASFGTWTAPFSPDEVKDYGEIVNWIVDQPWSNHKVGAYGISYDGNTAELLAVNNNPAVKAVAPLYNDFDPYAHLIYPGGIFNAGFTKGWNDSNKILDASPCSFDRVGEACKQQIQQAGIIGVKPVDEDKDKRLLAAAIQQHTANIDVFAAAQQSTYRDTPLDESGLNFESISPYNFKNEIERSNVAIYSQASWLDAGTANGALSRFMTFGNSQKVAIDAQTHGGFTTANPYSPSSNSGDLSQEEQVLALTKTFDTLWSNLVKFFDPYLKDNQGEPERRRELNYYTLVEDKWKTTQIWPPQDVINQRWFLAASNTLTRATPIDQSGEDKYTVNFEATTGQDTRWDQNPLKNFYPDRAEADKKLLVYNSEVLKNDVEITGNPVVTLYASSTADDGAFIVYLEDVEPNGRVTYITEGELRPLHRTVSQEPPYAIFGSYHSFKRQDGLPLEPEQVNELTFELLPTSVLIKQGHRIRIAIAGHDKDTFARYPAQDIPTIGVQRNAVHASYIDLPVMNPKQ